MKLAHVLLAALALPVMAPAYAVQESELVPAESAQEAEKAPLPYNAAGRRDPFRPFTVNVRPETRTQLTPLQQYELGQLTVVGTLWEVNPPRAMVEDSAGMGYIITLGTPIGRNGGVVTGIEPRRVLVEERVLDYYGNEQVNHIVMETPREEEPGQPARERK